MSKIKAVIAGIIFAVVAVGVVLIYLAIPTSLLNDGDKKNANDLSKRLKDRKKSIDDFLNHHPERKPV